MLDRAKRAWLTGNDEKAEELLISARYAARMSGDRAMLARTEVAMAEFTLAIDEDGRALSHLQSVGRVRESDLRWYARFWLCMSRLQRRALSRESIEGEEELSIPEYHDELVAFVADAMPAVPDINVLSDTDRYRPLAMRVYTELAARARCRGDLPEAERRLNEGLLIATEKDRALGMALLEKSEICAGRGDWQHAHSLLVEAAGLFNQLGLRRDEGRALIRGALQIAPQLPPGSDGSPVDWLARAKLVLDNAATWRDQYRMRQGFRTHGRRLEDKALGETVAMRIAKLETTAARLRSSIAAAVDRADVNIGRIEKSTGADSEETKELFREARSSLLGILEVASSEKRLIGQIGQSLEELISTAIVERNRMRGLLDLLARIDAFESYVEVARVAARDGARFLDADRLIIAQRRKGGDMEILAASEDTPGDDRWKLLIASRLKFPSRQPLHQTAATRNDSRRMGPTLVIPIQGGGIRGALYADKLKRSGQFTEMDETLAALFVDYLTLALSRLRAKKAERLAFEEISATVDTIRDGLIRIDAKGRLTSLNSAATRMLRVKQEDTVGVRLEEIPHLRPLADALASKRPLEGTLVRLKKGSFVITARPIRGDDRSRGLVATLVDIDRAHHMAQAVSSARPRYVFSDIIGESTAMVEAVLLAKQAAQVDASVLITGDSGTGKELIAQALHTGGLRPEEPFVGVNCAAVPRELLEAELFGYDRGAFTGARSDGNPGKFELAGAGMILLDEIGDMPIEMQAKLLRVLQERVVVRLGGSKERPVRARVVATTHRNLDQRVRTGHFRHDLLYRLRVLHIHLPTLDERGDDVLLLARSFLTRFAKEQNKNVSELALSVYQKFKQYRWPGNVRELANVLEREVSLLPHEAVTLDTLQTPLEMPQTSSQRLEVISPPDKNEIVPLATVEKQVFLRALDIMNGNVPAAARAIGVSKVTFYNKLRNWGLHPKDKGRQAAR